MEEGAFELGDVEQHEMAGMGVEATFMIQAAMAALTMVEAGIFCLTSPVTRRMQKPLAFFTEKGIGDDGYFTYPTQTARDHRPVYLPEQLEDVQPEVRALLEGIWQDPEGMVHQVHGPKGVEPQIQNGSVMVIATRTRKWRAWCVLVFMAVASACTAQTLIGKRMEVLQDSLQADLMGLAEVVQSDVWNPSNQTVPSLGLSEEVSWVRLKLDSRSENGQLIEIQNAGIDELTGYMMCDGKVIATYNRGVLQDGANDGSFGTYPTFPIPLVECGELHAVFRMKSSKPLLLPMRIAGPREVLNDAHQRDILFAAYFGVILVMLLYNLFLFFSVGDRSYLEYSLFIFMIGGTQLVLNGYAPYFNVEAWPWFNTRITHFFGVFSGLTTIVFAQNFLRLSR